jgi:threonine/homoserine/homoserine lactone efflux protein
LIGVMVGVAVHLLAAGTRRSVPPAAFNVIKLAGAAYLLAHGRRCAAEDSTSRRIIDPVPDAVLFRQSLTASVVNPKVAVFYLSLFPQFVDPASGSVLLQSLALGVVHISVGTLVDGTLVTIAGALSGWIARRAGWLRAQRWFLGGAFGVLAVWLAATHAIRRNKVISFPDESRCG